MGRRASWILVVAVMIVAACGDADTATTTSTSQASGDSTTTSTVVASEPQAPLFAGVDGTIALITSESGGGIRPLLEWEPVAGVDHYGVYLYAPGGSIYWSWTGTVTAVHVGGEPQLRDGAPGPSIVDGMSWAVIAYDADLLPIAVSPQRPIAP